MLVVGSVGAYFILASQKASSTHHFGEMAQVLADTIRNGLEQDMLRADRDHVKVSLDNLSRHEAIQSVDIVSTEGRVWASSKGADVGTILDGDVTHTLESFESHDIYGDPGNGFMTVVANVPAQQQCLQCHGSIASGPNSAGNLGAIRADISTAYLEESLTRSRILFMFVGGFTFLLVSGTLVFMLRRSILSPLLRITGAATAITRGDYQARAPEEKTGSELGEVATAFNKMVDRVERHTQELEDANRELARASRMKSEFLANMSHELRTPLNVIIGFSEVLRDVPLKQLDDADRQEFCENIISSGYHLLELINDVLDLAKVEAGQMNITLEEFPVASVVKDVIATMQPLAAKNNVQLGVEISEHLHSVYADINKFKQILYNLLGNAIKFTPMGGSVRLSGALAGEMARFSVTDTGIGIAPADQERIFSEFHQVDGSTARRFEGTGLGLALTRKFVDMQHGEIWVDSEVGMGSTFYFTVPLPQHSIVDAGPLSAREVHIASSGEHEAGPLPSTASLATVAERELVAVNPDSPCVLVVEDDPKTAELITLWLSQAGYNVDRAADGVTALDLAKEREHFAICLDIMLPRKDGWQVLHSLKNDPETADVNVIICSALDNPDLGFALGAADYCIKPLSRRPLLDKLRHLQKVSPGKRSTPMVLIADADAAEAAKTADILKRQGFNAVITDNGEKAKDVALELSPDVILVDTSIAEPGNFEVVAYLCKHPVTIDIPVVVTTSMEISREEEQELIASHVQKIIRKDEDAREQLLTEMFRLEKLNPERAKLLDPETRLFNRRYFDKRLAEELKRAERYALDLSVLLIHMDTPSSASPDFQIAFEWVAGLLRGNLRAADPLARFDAGSFAVLLPETHQASGLDAARKVVELVRSGNLQNDDGEDIKVTVSVAAAGCDHCQATADELIARLQKTLADIQKHGGNTAQLG